LNHVSVDQARFTRGGDQDMGSTRVVGQLARLERLAVAHHDRRVALQAQERERLADARRPADDDEGLPSVERGWFRVA
jgi:hypothetical protein